MKKLCILSVVLVFCFTSCIGSFFDSGEERVEVPDVPSTTVVSFNNTHNSYAVAVFPSANRIIETRIAVIEPYSTGYSEKSLFPTKEGHNFFLTYRLEIIDDVFINYSPITAIPSGTIRRNELATVLIPRLSDVVPASTPLVNDIYLAVKHNGSIAFSLGVNNYVADDVNGVKTITPENTGVYKISPGNSSSYRIMVSASNYEFESGIQFTAGNLYSYTFTGSGVIYNGAIPITRDNVK